MKHLFTTICLFVTLMCQAQQTTDKFFEYPVPPDELETLEDRTSYLVQRFWDKCNLKSAIQKRDQFKGAFIDYVSFMPYAEATVVHQSINNLLAKFEKDPKNLLTLAEVAEEVVYNEDGEFISDEIYMPFAQAVVDNKKISSAEKARFKRQLIQLKNTAINEKAPNFTFTRTDGTTSTLDDIQGSYILLFFNDPECDDCALARVRLSADNNITELIDRGYLKVISIYPDKYTAEWAASVSHYSPKWIVGASDEVDDIYDMRNPPVLYYLNSRHKILSKTLVVDGLLDAFRMVNNKLKETE